MAAKARRWIDPQTGDYVVEGGGPRGDDTRASQIVLRLRTHRGTCGALPAFGSRLHTIRKATQGAAKLATSYVYEAIDDLVRSGVIRDVQVDVDVVEGGGGAALEISVAFRDTASDRRTVRFTSRG